jgi:hypothetical protein
MMLSWQFCTRIPTMTRIGFSNESVRKKYDSANLHPKTRIQSATLVTRSVRVRIGYEAVNVCEARYLRDLLPTRSPNMRPEGTIEYVAVAMMAMANWM